MVTNQHNGSVEFAFFRPGAQSVGLVGDFTHHGAEGPYPLMRDAAGWWRCRMTLPPGEYRFRYLIDQKLWEADFAAYGVERDGNGEWSSVLWVNADWTPARTAA